MTLNKWHMRALATLLCLPATFCLATNTATAPSVDPPAAHASMQSMDDGELGEITGQALLNLSYLAPGEARDKAGTTITDTNNSGLGFYTMGLEGRLEINANIRKLQLGCGGVNGPGDCDIDIDYLSLSGCGASSCTSVSNPASTDRVSSDAVLTNPFIQFAIKNPNNPATREIVGYRLGAQNANGLMTFGQENTSTPGGINTLSGYLPILQATGVGDVLPMNISYGCSQAQNPVTNCGTFIDPVTMQLNGTGVNCQTVAGGCTLSTNIAMVGTLCLYLGFECAGNAANTEGKDKYASTDYRLPLRAAGTTTYPVTGAACTANKVCFTTNAATLSGSRMKTAELTGAANIPTIDFTCSGRCTYADTSYLGISLNAIIQGTMTGLRATVPVSESLGMIHRLAVNSPFSISAQGQKVFWPGASALANQGWWMAFDDPVDLGNVNTTKPIVFTQDVLRQALCGSAGVTASNLCATNLKSYNGHGIGAAGGVNESLWYQRGGEVTESAVGTLVSPTINVGAIPVSAVLTYPLTNPQLSAQNFSPNCYGSSKFC